MTDQIQKVLLTAPYMLIEQERFVKAIKARGYEVVLPPYFVERLEEEELLALVSDIVGAIVGDDRFTRRVLQEARQLRVIWKWGTGVDSIDQKAARELGIAIKNTPGAFTDPVADTVMGMVLCFARNIASSDRLLKAGKWKKLPGLSLRETTLGVVGAGSIGQAVLSRANTFGMRLLANDVREVNLVTLPPNVVTFVDLDELLRSADFVSVNCDLNDSSWGLFGAREFSIMKPTSVLINTARGPIVDEQALVEALLEGRIAGAGLDVFEREPLPHNSRLRKMQNVLLSAHAANASPECWERVHIRTLEGLFAALEEG